MPRPTDEELQHNSEAETLVGDESDDDTLPNPRPSAPSQPAAGNEVARWLGDHEPCAPTQSNIDAATRAEQLSGMKIAGQRSDSLISGAQANNQVERKRKRD
jgi:hypothetical protein